MIKLFVKFMTVYDAWEDKCVEMYGENARLACTICLGIFEVAVIGIALITLVNSIMFFFA